MRNISGQYQDLLEGKITQAQFLRNARMMFPNYITNLNSFQDSVTILKQKGMLVEGNAVKGTPDKEPTYDYPTQPAKYKKVEQSPEVDEQDGIYPATTLTDIPKEEVSKPVKSKTRPDGLEDIKDNDTKNEMKKVKVVKEGIHDKNILSAPHTNIKTPPKGVGDYDPKKRAASLARLKDMGPKKDVKEAKGDTPLKDIADAFMGALGLPEGPEQERALQAVYRELGNKIKSKATNLYNATREKVLKYSEPKDKPMNENKIPPDTASLLTILKRIEAQTKAKFFAINNADELKDVFDYILDRVNPTLASSITQLRTALNQAFDSNIDTKKAGVPPSTNTKDKLKPVIEKLIQEVLDEMGQK